jgi:hypothetical protein
MMNEDERRDEENNDEQPEGLELGPTEKLEGLTSNTGSLIPGAQNPESEEVKKEINPNTE